MAIKRKVVAWLAGLSLFATAAWAADNFAINNATGTFTVIRCTDSAGVCTINAILAASSAVIGHVIVDSGSISVTSLPGTPSQAPTASITNPTSTLTRPADIIAYAQNDIIASSTTAGSVVVPSFAIANTAGGAILPRLRLVTNVTTGWDAAVLRVRLYSAAPTYTNGDNGAYARATGSSGYLGRYDITLNQQGDGAVGIGAPLEGSASYVKLASGTAVFWDLQIVSAAALTPIASQTFTLTAEALN